MSNTNDINIEIQGGTSARLLTAGKYCDRDIIVTAAEGDAGEGILVVPTTTVNFQTQGNLTRSSATIGYENPLEPSHWYQQGHVYKIIVGDIVCVGAPICHEYSWYGPPPFRFESPYKLTEPNADGVQIMESFGMNGSMGGDAMGAYFDVSDGIASFSPTTGDIPITIYDITHLIK